MSEDGILQISFAGNLDFGEMSSFIKDISVFLEAATEISPVHSVAHISAIGNISADARDIFIELNRDDRFGYMACVGSNRRFRVLTKFMENAAQRDNIRLFTLEDDAINWLNEKNREGNPRLRVENLS
jgi:hypothetical protein